MQISDSEFVSLGNLTSDTLYFHNMQDLPLFDRFTYAVPSALSNSAPPHTSDACWAQSYWSLTPSAVQILYPPSLLLLWWMVPVVCSSHCTFLHYSIYPRYWFWSCRHGCCPLDNKITGSRLKSYLSAFSSAHWDQHSPVLTGHGGFWGRPLGQGNFCRY